MFNNKCSKCGQAATHKFTRISNGQVYDIYLCSAHAAEMSPYQKSNLSDIIEGLLAKQEIGVTPASAPSGLRCRACGLPFEAYRKNYMLGCSECYEAFREQLVQDLRKFHGATRHFGRRPGGGKIQFPEGEAAMPVRDAEAQELHTAGSELSQQRLRTMIEDLESKLEKAIKNEDFEKAAQYRDLLREVRLKSHT